MIQAKSSHCRDLGITTDFRAQHEMAVVGFGLPYGNENGHRQLLQTGAMKVLRVGEDYSDGPMTISAHARGLED